MINLLPPDFANRIRFGRSNAILRHWILGACIAIIGLLIILAGGSVYLRSQTSQLKNQLDKTNAQLTAKNLSQVQKDATEINNDIKIINKVLGSEVRFSDLVQDIGKVMPPGTVLSSLSLSQINGALDLSVSAKDYSSATQVAVNLEDPSNGLFSKVDILSISCSDNNAVYRCTGTLKALFSPDAQKKYQSVPQGGNK
jgi:Tfp pilus assembly protein PilN